MRKENMIDQDTTVVLAAITAAASLLGSFVGGVVLPYLTHRPKGKAEKRKRLREKVEEMCLLADQGYQSGFQNRFFF
jgi:hypothetical protein